MFGISRGRPAGGDTLAEAHAVGDTSGSGHVGADSPVRTNPDSGGRVDDLGRHVVHTNPQADPARYPGVVTRPMLGGVRTAGHSRLMRDAPPFDGGHVVLTNRASVVILAPSEQLNPDAPQVLPSLRVPPPSDPYGRACANAKAAAAASGAR